VAELRCLGQDRGQAEGGIGQHNSSRRANLRPAAKESATVSRRMLDCQQDGAAPLAAESQALDQPQANQKQWRDETDLVVGRQHADERRRAAHQQHRPHQHRPTTKAVAEVAEDRPAQRPREERAVPLSAAAVPYSRKS
jgi:hypothetical protein